MRRHLRIVLIVTALALGPAASASAASPAPAMADGIGIRLLDIPVATQDDPRARSYVVDRVQPGATITRRVQVQNGTSAPQSVKVYAGGARIDGGSFVGLDGATPDELTSWIAVAQPTLQLAPGATADVPVTIAVPDDAAEGERYAAVWAEVAVPAEAGATIAAASRVGVRVYLSVGPGNGPPADFAIGSVVAGRDDAGAPRLVASVTNTGGRAVDVSGTLALSGGPGGLSAGPSPVDAVTTIAPGGTGEVAFTLAAGIPAGPWTAQLALTSGLVAHATTADVTFPDVGSTTAVQQARGPDLALVLGVAAAVIALLVALVVVLLLRRRRAARAAATIAVTAAE
ncbi:hypothetical protein ITJ44_12730 [Clavibacter sp. VKM Ac-2873]|uniref:hypothetical protein n=1 Tax=Clavibacter sp. VKM Ac-2873 TaxID=2783813 RepID=UPI00188B915A|nr:hypothetical protein [Clavibacter sp. VKM Ac-2873]MBF4618937.1 hypothetical protein [Clavibacter sp. VKM Ac-2873]